MGTPTVPLRVCGLLLIIGQIAISGAGVLGSCLLQEPGSVSVYAGQDAKQACLPIFFRDVGLLKNKHIFLLTMYQNYPYIEGQLSMLQPTMR